MFYTPRPMTGLAGFYITGAERLPFLLLPDLMNVEILLFFSLLYVNLNNMYDNNFDRITQNPAVMGGKPCIRGMRVTVGMIVGQIGAGVTIEELLSDYPYLEREDILQALQLSY